MRPCWNIFLLRVFVALFCNWQDSPAAYLGLLTEKWAAVPTRGEPAPPLSTSYEDRFPVQRKSIARWTLNTSILKLSHFEHFHFKIISSMSYEDKFPVQRKSIARWNFFPQHFFTTYKMCMGKSLLQHTVSSYNVLCCYPNVNGSVRNLSLNMYLYCPHFLAIWLY